MQAVLGQLEGIAGAFVTELSRTEHDVHLDAAISNAGQTRSVADVSTCQSLSTQSEDDHQRTTRVVESFLANEGPKLHAELQQYASTRPSYIEEFWDESYLTASESVVLNLNPFFILEDDPTPSRGNQLMRAASLTLASLCFIHDLRHGVLEPDNVRGSESSQQAQTTKQGSVVTVKQQCAS